METIYWNFYPMIALTPVARRFIESVAKRQLRPKTIDAYARNLDNFLRYCQAQQPPIDILEATLDEIESYIDWLYRQPSRGRKKPSFLSPCTIQQRITTLRLFYDFCMHRGLSSHRHNPIARNSSRGRRTMGPVAKAHARSLPWIPSDQEWETLVRHILVHTSPRNQALLFLTYHCALRRQEAIRVTLPDLDWEHGILTIPPESAKSGRMRKVPYPASVAWLLQRYIAGDRQHILNGFGGDPQGPLFLSESQKNPGQPLRIGALNDIVEHLRLSLNFPLLHPHTFRHLRCTMLRRCGISLPDIALFAGHQDLATTQIYIHLTPLEVSQRIREAVAPFDELVGQWIAKATNGK